MPQVLLCEGSPASPGLCSVRVVYAGWPRHLQHGEPPHAPHWHVQGRTPPHAVVRRTCCGVTWTWKTWYQNCERNSL